MNTIELKQDVLRLTRANTRDYTDTEIESNIDREYSMLQELLKKSQRVEWTGGNYPVLFDFGGITDTFIQTSPNLHIERVEVSINGGDSWYPVSRTDKTTYNTASANNSCYCSKRSLTDALEDGGNPINFIQTTSGIQVFPIPEDDSIDVNIYVKESEDIDWNNPLFVPNLPDFAHRLLTLKAALLYRDIEDTNELTFLKNDYNELYKVFLDHISEGGKVINMGMKFRKYK